MNAVRTLKQLIKDVHNESGFGNENWTIIGQYAIDAMREINMFHSKKRFKITKVNVDLQTNTFDWPTDYIGMQFLGIPVNGKVWTLTKDGSLITTTTLVNGQETLTSSQGEGVIPFESQTVGYGATGGKNSLYYNEDELNRRTFIIGANPVNVLLAYISDGIEDMNSLIPVKFKPIIIYFCRWKYYERDTSMDLNKASYFKDQFEQECNKLKAFEDPTLDEIYDALLSESNATYKK